ncbi:MAG TPA: YdbH domain-containing protein [Rhizomicrobium sp.]|nr:YdbH domain-containing protein [Rhizomicrobium sp.]
MTFARLGLSGLSGRIALGPADAPDFSADAVEVDFDPLSFVPRIVEVRLINSVVRARLDDNGQVTLSSLQPWLDSLSAGQGHSRYVSDDLAVSFSHLRALLAAPGGALELDGDARLKQGQIVSATILARPTLLIWRGTTIRVAGAGLRLDPVPDGYGVAAHFEGSLKNGGLEATEVAAQFSAPSFRWDVKAKSVTALNVRLQLRAAALTEGGITAAKPILDMTAEAAHVVLGGNGPEGTALLHTQVGADFTPPAPGTRFPVLARDRRLTEALTANLRHLDVVLNANVAWKDGFFSLALNQHMDIKGAKGAALRINTLELTGPPSALRGHFEAALSGPGLPSLSLRNRDFRWQDGAAEGDAVIAAHFDFDMLHGADIAAGGIASWRNGVFAFDLTRCATAFLAAFHPGDSDLAQTIKGTICAMPGNKTITADASGWKFSGVARDVTMALPLGNAQLSEGAGSIAFAGRGADMGGKIAVTAARMTDRAQARRFEPLAGTGEISLDKWVWHGAFAVADTGGNTLGTASFNHALATGMGEMKIAAPHLLFAPGKLQPSMLSPLLGPVSRAEGDVAFDGTIDWTRGAIQSRGVLGINKLDFFTPLGVAHAVNANIILTSLLPPVTAPGQHIAISRVDWSLPLSGIALDFSFGAGTLHVDSLASTISEGNVRLSALAIDLTGPRAFSGAANLDGVSLAPLVAASNLGSKVKLEGKVAGTVPFSFGPDGFRIVNGHLASLGPGRISLDRSVWTQGGAAAANAVQDLAYQALEYLAYDQLSADINSVAQGRLQVVFHIKGRSDPPKPQQAEIAVADIINGNALQKTIALPSGTPIDLTLDTSLNFDELLKSYAEAWSKTLAQTGQSN